METYLTFAFFVAVSILWACLWVKTYKALTIKRFIIHTIIFIFLSLLIAWLAMQLIFLPVDDTYSASNIGALGLLFFMFLACFGSACISAFGISLGKLIDNGKNENQENNERLE